MQNAGERLLALGRHARGYLEGSSYPYSLHSISIPTSLSSTPYLDLKND